ncbi:tripartite tricarboxylate transporter TctB family protein [Pseudalkalibacillus sp. A8]|uniref:tripartite tricarboxylate transporter TctB family protein n=1 Tax=Pseudalkalibacillus sp. A8 TaxID=3382641 RepID=UPI0038B4CF8B
MVTWKNDLILSVFLLILSVFVYAKSLKMPTNAGEFPILLSIVLGILSILLLFSSFKKKKQDAGSIKYTNIQYIFLGIIAMLIYSVILSYLGYLLSTLFLFLSILFLIGYRKKTFGVLIGVIIVVAIFAIFKIALNVPLPEGLFY